MGFVRDETAIQHLLPSNKPGMARAGSSKEISKPVSIMHLDAPLKNASAGKFQNAVVETAPTLLANPEKGRDVSLDLCRLESFRYGYDHKSNEDQCQGQLQSAKS